MIMLHTPVLFISHGPGPAWLMDERQMPPDWKNKNMGITFPEVEYIKNLMEREGIPKPHAVLLICAH